MALAKNATRIRVQGGGRLELKEQPSGSWLDVGYLGGSEIVTESNDIIVHDERGVLVSQQEGNVTVKFNSNLLQSGIDEVKLLRDCKGKTYQARYTVQLPDDAAGDEQWQAWTLGYRATLSRNSKVPFQSGSANMIPIVLTLTPGPVSGHHYDVSASSTEASDDGDWPTIS